MNKEIEEIKKELTDAGYLLKDCSCNACRLWKLLLSSLEKAREEIDEFMRNEYRYPTLSEFSNLQDELKKEKEKAEKAEAKVRELDDRIEKLVLLIDEYAGRITKVEERVKDLVKAVEKHQIKHNACIKNKITEWEMSQADEELYKVLEEVSK